ncbi:glycosyltransferase [Rhodoferax saidenbachensis]|uniref:Glycosyl transferase family 28 C-terminal domain-containing protein n=1 Tax=Rhodoferax saidenbachensis TaxID=1484693 RepID=A0A1P8KCW7_9BURK|nr:hypothetical protein [Rhodoferax saidenbachensis]APW43867.1 hypothetical protein RS694_15895 [Rhodoferax saidenbachensis]
MARVLCVWEQGSNLGHLSNLRAPIQAAQDLGHEITLVARELHRIPEVMSGLRFGLMQAPFKQFVPKVDATAIQCYAQLLAIQCFSSPQELLLYVRAWRAIFDLLRPDIVFFEHSPTALVAAWTYGFRKVLVGSGFDIPRTDVLEAPLQAFPTAPRTAEAMEQLRTVDQQVLELINQVHAVQGGQAMPRLGALYAQAEAQCLMTWPEMDCFGPRPGIHYLGREGLQKQPAPEWPAGTGPKVFGYLSNFTGLEFLLQALQAAQVCVLLFVRDISEELRSRYTGAGLAFTSHLVDLAQVTAEADWVVHHANHGTSATFLLAGLPQLAIPLHQEQLFNALRLVGQSCALLAYQDQANYGEAVAAMCQRTDLRAAAKSVQEACKLQESGRSVEYFRGILG